MTGEQKRAKYAIARVLRRDLGESMSMRQVLKSMDKLEEVELITPIDGYIGGVWLAGLNQVVMPR